MELEGLGLEVVHDVAVDVDRPAVDGLEGDAGEGVGVAVEEVAGVALGAVHFAAVVEHFADVVVVEVDGAADGAVVGVHAVFPVADAVVADDVPAAAEPDRRGIRAGRATAVAWSARA